MRYRETLPVLEGTRAMLAGLDEAAGPLTAGELAGLLARLQLTSDELQSLSFFDSDCYRRNVLRRTEHYEALLLCWCAGQASPIHDHSGSACAFRVFEGIAAEEVFLAQGERLLSMGLREYPQGSVGCSVDDDVHRITNQGPGNLVTVHLYSPPLDKMQTFAESRVAQPMNDWQRRGEVSQRVLAEH